MTLTVGAWVIPLFITLAAFGVAIGGWPKSRGDYDLSPLFGCGFLLGAAVVSLTSWLVWSLL